MQPELIVYAGDTVEIEFQLYKNENTYWDITNYQIRFQLNYDPPIKKASANVPGGSNEEITIIDAIKGKFIVIIKAGELLTPGDYDYEIEITSLNDNKKYTVIRDKIRVLKQIIDWESK